MGESRAYKNKSVGIILLLILSILWGSSYGLIAAGLESFPFLSFMALRSTVAVAILLVILLVTRTKFHLSARLWVLLFLQSIVGNVVPMLFVAWAQQSVSSATATVLGSTIPIFILLLGLVYGAETKPSLNSVLGVSVGFVGVILAFGGDIEVLTLDNALPYGALLGSSISYALASMMAKKLSAVPALISATVSMLWAAIILLVASAYIGDYRDIRWSASSVLILSVLGIFCTGVAFWILFYVRNALGAVVASTQVYLRLPVGIFVGVAFLGEEVSLMAATGYLCIGLGVMLMITPMSRLLDKSRRLFGTGARL